MTEHAVMALRGILIKALRANTYDSYTDLDSSFDEWDRQFASMEFEEQADWLIQLFQELSHSDLEQAQRVMSQLEGYRHVNWRE